MYVFEEKASCSCYFVLSQNWADNPIENLQSVDDSPGIAAEDLRTVEPDLDLESSSGVDEFEEDEEDVSPSPNSMLEITVEEDSGPSYSAPEKNLGHYQDLRFQATPIIPSVTISLAQTPAVRNKKLQCPECSASFANQYNLDRHIESHNSTRPHKCTICPDQRGFLRKVNFLYIKHIYRAF